MKKAIILGGITLGLPLLAEDSSSIDSFKKSLDFFETLGIDLKSILLFYGIFVVISLVINILFLRSVSSFAKSMKLSNSLKETSAVWIWTQLIPMWNYVAIPVSFIKLNEQYKEYVLENSSTEVKTFKPIWGWSYYISLILIIVSSFLEVLIPTLFLIRHFLWLVCSIGFIGFWVHISKVRKSIVTSSNI